MSSSIMLCIISLTLAALSLYNAVKCGRAADRFKAMGHTVQAEIVSCQKRRSPTSAGSRYTVVTWHDITVRFDTPDGQTVTRTIRTSNPMAGRYRKKTRADIAVLFADSCRTVEIYIKEDMKNWPERALSLALFVSFSVIFILGIIGIFV